MNGRQLKKLPESLPLMQKMYERLTGEVIEIDTQVREAKSLAASTGEYKPADWFVRANKALRIKRAEMQRLQVLIAQEKKRNRIEASTSFDGAFVEAARAFLSQSDFQHIMKAALGRMPAAQKDTP